LSSSGLEPGLLRALRMLTLVQVLGAPLVRRAAAVTMGVELPLLPYVEVSIPAPMVLLALVWVPGLTRRAGSRLLPAIATLECVHLLAVKIALVGWVVTPVQRDLLSLMLLVRFLPHFHAITLLVAWQYSWRAGLGSALALCIADSVITLVFANIGGPLYPVLLMLLVTRLATVAGGAAGVGWLLERQREQKASLASANRRLADYAASTEQLAISQERNRLARELHDTLAHSVTAVTVQLEAIQALWATEPTSARAMLDSALQTAHSGSREARRALKALRASPLEDGLCVAIGNLARAAAARADLQLALTTPDDWTTAPPDQEQFLYRVAQEAIANVVRHARATELRVALERRNGYIALSVADNGVGFVAGAVNTAARFGLKGIEERVEMIGGRLSVESAPGSGTTVRVAVPMAGIA
jgi:signal transduction histidine kinase